MERASRVSHPPPNAKEHTMSHDLHESTAVDVQRSCTPATTISVLHDERKPSFGRWLGQINRQD
jgi:hypothetical protein